MAEKENMQKSFAAFPKLEEVFSAQGIKRLAAQYIDTNEKLAYDLLDLQAKATAWAKDTPFAPVFEAQNEFGRRFVERSVNAARNLWQLDKE